MISDLLGVVPHQGTLLKESIEYQAGDVSVFVEDLEDLLSVVAEHVEGSAPGMGTSSYDFSALGNDLATFLHLASPQGDQSLSNSNSGTLLPELSLFVEDLELLSHHASSFADLGLVEKDTRSETAERSAQQSFAF